MDRATIETAIRAAGFTPRGAFYPTDTDRVPLLAGGIKASTIMLVGNAGPAMWNIFADALKSVTDRLDDWVVSVLDPLAREFNATALYPHAGPPFHPFQRWAQRADAVAPSPLGILIHPDYGLWHGYRAALLFKARLDLPPPDRRPSPCATCADKPCLTTCPVGAFTAAGYDLDACAGHIAQPAGEDCMGQGCRARRACPVGRRHVYAPAQAAFHMAAFLRARRTS